MYILIQQRAFLAGLCINFVFLFHHFSSQTFARVEGINSLLPRFCPQNAQKVVFKIGCPKPAKAQYYCVFAGSFPLKIFTHPMYIASPNEKNRYLSFTAVSYAFIIFSFPASAETSIKSVDSGRWKFVIR